MKANKTQTNPTARKRMEVGKRVHIVSVGIEVARIAVPILSDRGERVIIFRHNKPSSIEKHFRAFIDEVRARLKTGGIDDIHEREVDLFDFQDLVGAIGWCIREEQNSGNEIFVNVSGGSRLFDAAGLTATMMFGGRPYYVPVDKYLKLPDEFYVNGKPVGTAEVVGEPAEIPRFIVDPPEEDLIHFLAILTALDPNCQGVSQTGLIPFLKSAGLLSSDSGGKHPEKVRALGELRRGFIHPLRREKWIAIEGERRGAKTVVTPLGATVVRMFAPVYSSTEIVKKALRQ